MKKIALVGCGRISQRHIEAIQATEGVEIAIVCDVVESKAKKASELLGGIPYTTDFHTLCDVDAVSVLTPSGLHPRHVIELAESTNIPYIICEKPISLTVREAIEMMDRVTKAGKTLLPVYQNRYNPLVAFTRELIQSGKLGKIFQFVNNIFWSRGDEYFAIDWHGTQDLDGGVLYTQASHYVDMIHYFFGEIKQSKGIGGSLRKLEVQDTISAVCEFESGVVGTINATVSTYQKNFLTEFTLIAEKGTIRLSGTNLNKIDFWNVEGMERPNMDFSINHEYGKGHDMLYRYFADGRLDVFPSREDILSGIALMQRLSY